MNEALLKPFAPLFSIFGPVVLGITIGFVSRQHFAGAKGAKREVVAQWCEAVALKVLLPFFLFEAVVKNEITATLLIALLVGFTLPLATLFVCIGLRSVRSSTMLPTVHNAAFPFLVGTFGGGNRGTAFFMLLLYFSPNFTKHLAWFSAVDLGNFLCQYTVVAYLMARTFRPATAAAEPRAGIWRVLAGNYAVSAFGVMLALVAARAVVPSLDVMLGETVQFRRAVFAVLVFAALTMRFDLPSISRTLVPDVVVFVAIRLAVASAVIVCAVPFLPVSLSLMLAVLVISIMPPSSAAPAMLTQAGAPAAVVRYASSFAVATSLLYIVALVLCALFVVIRLVDVSDGV